MGFWSVMGSVLGSVRYCADYAESSGFAALTGTAEIEYNQSASKGPSKPLRPAGPPFVQKVGQDELHQRNLKHVIC
jgi:hypothetical protein